MISYPLNILQIEASQRVDLAQRPKIQDVGATKLKLGQPHRSERTRVIDLRVVAGEDTSNCVTGAKASRWLTSIHVLDTMSLKAGRDGTGVPDAWFKMMVWVFAALAPGSAHSGGRLRVVRHNTSTGAANPSQKIKGTLQRRPIVSREMYTLADNQTLFVWNNTVIDCGTCIEGKRGHCEVRVR